MLKTELLAGDGPDLILAQDTSLFDDIYKTMDSGIFMDLTETLNADTAFNWSLYNKTVMDSGIYKGKRYIMPISYSILPLMVINETLEEENINFADFSTLEGFTGAIRKYMANNMNNPDKYVTWSQSGSNIMTSFLNYSNINILDYENRKVDLSDSNIKNLADTSKDIANYVNNPVRKYSSYNSARRDENGGIIYKHDATVGLRTGRIFFNDRLMFSVIENFYFEYGGLTFDRTPLFTNFPGTNGGTTAMVIKFAGIRQTSENKKNAYNFMKMLLSYDIQMLPAQNPNTDYNLNIPVLMSAAKAYAKVHWEKSDMWGTPDGSIIWEKVPDEVHEQFIDMIINVDSCVLPAYAPSNLVLQGFEPYFNGEKTYEACISDLKTRLEIYLSE